MVKVVALHPADEVDLAELTLSDEQLRRCRLETPTTKRLRAKRYARFALGPIPIEWAVACQTADPNGFLLAIGIIEKQKRRVDYPTQKWVLVADLLGKSLNLGRDQRRRAIAGLERAGLAEVERKSNHAPRVRLIPWKFDPQASDD